MSKKHRLQQLKAWAKLALQDAVLVRIASSANSPTQAYELAYLETRDEGKAQSCRWLAILKRDYGKDVFDSLFRVSSDSPRKYPPTKSALERTGERKGASPMGKSKDKVESEAAVLLPLRHVSFTGALNGAFARVRCSQKFGNDAKTPVEAVYVFPLPDDATVTACKMRIGKRDVEAVLKKREEARKEYDDAVAAGHHGALLEQQRANIFTMNVGGIEPGETIDVDVDYVQRVPWQAGGGRFRVPLVVPPQFIPGTPKGKSGGGFAHDTDAVPDASRITPIVAKGGVPYNADISVLFSPGFRCKLSCPSHPTIIADKTVAKADKVELKTGDIRTDRDFTLVYTSLSRVPEVAAHVGTHGEGKDKETFVLASVIPPGDADPVGSDIVLVLDCSGSMSGPSISGLRKVAAKVVEILRQQKVGHHVGVLPFDTVPWSCHPISDITDATVRFIEGLEARGGTMLGLALTEAERMLGNSGRPKAILMVTDGDTENGKNWHGKDIRLIAVGIGTAINDTRVKTLATNNNGVAETVYPGEDYGAVAGRLAGFLSGPVLQGVSVETRGDVVGVSDVFKGRPATIAVRFTGKPGAVSVSGNDPHGKRCVWDVDVSSAKECDFAAQIWCREAIREKADNEDEVTELSLKYGVVCQHTSFVAVSLKTSPTGKPERVEIPVNLPDGWDYDKVFGIAAVLGAGLARRGVTFGAPTVDSMLMEFGASDSAYACGAAGGSAKGGVLGRVLRGRVRKTPPTPPRPTRPTPKPAQPAPTRFRLDATDVVDRMVAVLNAVLGNNRAGAEAAFETVCKELTVKAAKALDAVKTAQACYFALRLLKHGLKLDKSVMSALDYAPKKVLVPAWYCWYQLCLKEMGRPFDTFVPSAPFDGSEYVAWKLGHEVQPTSGDWANVV